MDYQITTAPMHEPVSLQQAKRHLRIDGTDSDTLIGTVLRAARDWSEGFMNRAFLWQTIAIKRDNLRSPIRLPLAPLIAVSSITYVDAAGSTQTVGTTIYDVDVTTEPGQIVLAYNQSWPSVRGHHHDVTITFIAGHAKPFTRTANTVIVAGHLYQVNDPVQVYNIGGALPAGLSAGTTYYVRSISGHTIELAATEGGTGVPMSDAGTGTHYIDALPGHIASGILLVLTDFWMHRGDERLEPSKAVRELLSMGRMVAV